jgi:hypothetical protein
LNAGLDVAYVMTGFFLIEKGKNSANNADRLKGFGYSLILQGGFLFAFDLIMYFTHSHNADLMLYPVIDGIYSDNLGIGLTLNFNGNFL